MNDDRFDDDLRSVLLEDAPTLVPDDLRQRVARVPDQYPIMARTARPIWRRTVPVWAGAIAAVVVLAFGVWRFGPIQAPGVGGPTSSPSAALSSAPSAAPTSAPSSALASPKTASQAPASVAPAGPAACPGSTLSGRILDWQGAAGSRIADVLVTNTGSTPCYVRGTPGLELIDANGRVLIGSNASEAAPPSVAPSDPTFDLAAGGTVKTMVQVSNYCGAPGTMPIRIRFNLPASGGSFTANPGPGVSSAEAIPPCNGPGSPAHIAMNGWRR